MVYSPGKPDRTVLLRAENAALRARVEALEARLAPFARYAEALRAHFPGGTAGEVYLRVHVPGEEPVAIRAGDFRALLEKEGEKDD